MEKRIAKAQSLAEQLKGINKFELDQIKKKIVEWAKGDNWARCYVERYAYAHRDNRHIIAEIFELIEG